MKIRRILNNNAVIVLDKDGEEIIIKGKGIAFKKVVGDELDESKIEKKFVLDNQETSRKYQDILVNIPNDCIDISEKAVDIIKENINKELSDRIYVTLTDHISNLVERLSMGIVFNNALLWDIKRLYKDEYLAGLKVVQLLRDKFDIKVGDDEASFIALHIVNAQMNVEFEEVFEITTMIEDIYEIVASDFGLSLDEESLDYNRFILHLRFFFDRVINKKSLGIEKSDKLLDIMKKEYPNHYACVRKIVDYVTIRYNEPVEGEVLYLLLHVVKLTG